jgi:hypothetical protein
MIVSSRKQFIKDVIPQKTLGVKMLRFSSRAQTKVLISPGGSNVLLEKRYLWGFKQVMPNPPYPPLEKVGISGTFLMELTGLSRVKAKFSEKKLDIIWRLIYCFAYQT